MGPGVELMQAVADLQSLNKEEQGGKAKHLEDMLTHDLLESIIIELICDLISTHILTCLPKTSKFPDESFSVFHQGSFEFRVLGKSWR